MSDARRTVRAMDANTPPKPGTPEHWAAWLDRYGDDYATDDERHAAYQDFQTNLTTMHAVFSQPDRMHTAGYLAAHERVADGDADSPDDAELWAPVNLSGPQRADWLEGFRSHFEPGRSRSWRTQADIDELFTGPADRTWEADRKLIADPPPVDSARD